MRQFHIHCVELSRSLSRRRRHGDILIWIHFK